MMIDAAQYAGIAAQMSETNSYLEIFEFKNDYLDKPPLLFWLSSVSIEIFGINNFAYKFPSFLFLLFSLYAVYRFALLFYTPKIAKYALLILASSQAYFLITNDVRTDSLLTSCVIIAVWFFSEYFEKSKLQNLIFGSIFTALAMLAKGPIGLIAIMLPIGIQLLYFKKWNHIFNLRSILIFGIIAVILIPMSYGLYTQFDLQPEKITNGIKGQKGLYFYYWLQSFGRITGENVWNNNTPWYFFITSSLWDFFPWFLPLCFALWYKIKDLLMRNKLVPEIISLVGFVAIFSMLSLSKYKLPHYVFVTYPFGAILLGEYFANLKEKVWRNWCVFYNVLAVIILALLIVYPIFLFKEFSFWILFCIILQLLMLIFFKKNSQNSLIQVISLIVGLNFFFSFVFYPKLLTFQADSCAAKWAKENIINEPTLTYNVPLHSFNFYIKNPFTKSVNASEMREITSPFWLYVNHENWAEISNMNINITKKVTFYDYPITRLNLNFLTENKRTKELSKSYLIKIEN